ncbi:hypothetical protein QQS21_009765 [Conoideocrella luteorostrata]|uniref:Uncharacterized protein n=1 Tax=Conoideocrella luteorostrata TaxID=1105319 RepID=A0AAJ0CGB5_9HYPO|nr:hypothetical protein QQS21_009765 [Conoideocrella luteorostrata]
MPRSKSPTRSPSAPRSASSRSKSSAPRAASHRLPSSPSQSPSRSRTPSQSRSPSRSRPDSRRRSLSRGSSSRRSYSSSSGHSSPRRGRRRPSQQEKDQNRGKLIKDSAGLLLGIGVAAVVAHKFWPKGMLYGGKEDWENKVEKAADKVKDKVKEKVFGEDENDRHDDRYDQYREEYHPRPPAPAPAPPRELRGRSHDGAYYYPPQGRLLDNRRPGPEEPRLLRSRSRREHERDREFRAQSFDPPPGKKVYEQVEVARRDRPPMAYRQGWIGERREPSHYPSERHYHQQPRGSSAPHTDDQIIVVEQEGLRHGRRH